jgi:hypothetical protein
MKRVRTGSLCLVLVCAIGAMAATSASAAPNRIPGTGECYYAGIEAGNFTESFCESYAKPKDWDWCWNDQAWPNPCPVVHRWVWETEKIALATTTKFEVKCTKLRGSGTYTTSGNQVLESVALTGCGEVKGASCESAKAESGVVNTDELEGQLGFIDAASGEVGLALSSPSGVLMAFNCGATTVAIRGSVVGTVPANKAESKLKLSYKAKKGKQEIAGFEGTTTSLEASVNGAPYEPIGLTTSIAQVNEDKKIKAEIRCKNVETEEVEAC